MKKGRPKSYRLSDETKKLISDYRTGKSHSEKTKQKISSGVMHGKRPKKTVSFRIDPALLEFVKATARSQNRPIAHIFELAIFEFCKTK